MFNGIFTTEDVEDMVIAVASIQHVLAVTAVTIMSLPEYFDEVMPSATTSD